MFSVSWGDSIVGVKPAIAQLVEHLTVELAEIRWSLVQFRVAGFAWRHTWIKSWQMFCNVISTAYWAGALPTKLKRQWRLPANHTHSGWRSFSGPSWAGTRAERLKFEVTVHIVRTQSLGNWLFGLVAWFSLRVREVLGSVPTTALCDATLKQIGRCVKADHARP